MGIQSWVGGAAFRRCKAAAAKVALEAAPMVALASTFLVIRFINAATPQPSTVVTPVMGTSARAKP
jgi:hypothetical protein